MIWCTMKGFIFSKVCICFVKVYLLISCLPLKQTENEQSLYLIFNTENISLQFFFFHVFLPHEDYNWAVRDIFCSTLTVRCFARFTRYLSSTERRRTKKLLHFLRLLHVLCNLYSDKKVPVKINFTEELARTSTKMSHYTQLVILFMHSSQAF